MGMKGVSGDRKSIAAYSGEARQNPLFISHIQPSSGRLPRISLRIFFHNLSIYFLNDFSPPGRPTRSRQRPRRQTPLARINQNSRGLLSLPSTSKGVVPPARSSTVRHDALAVVRLESRVIDTISFPPIPHADQRSSILPFSPSVEVSIIPARISLGCRT